MTSDAARSVTCTPAGRTTSVLVHVNQPGIKRRAKRLRVQNVEVNTQSGEGEAVVVVRDPVARKLNSIPGCNNVVAFRIPVQANGPYMLINRLSFDLVEEEGGDGKTNNGLVHVDVAPAPEAKRVALDDTPTFVVDIDANRGWADEYRGEDEVQTDATNDASARRGSISRGLLIFFCVLTIFVLLYVFVALILWLSSGNPKWWGWPAYAWLYVFGADPSRFPKGLEPVVS